MINKSYKKKILNKMLLVRIDEETYRIIKKNKINASELCRDAIEKYLNGKLDEDSKH